MCHNGYNGRTMGLFNHKRSKLKLRCGEILLSFSIINMFIVLNMVLIKDKLTFVQFKDNINKFRQLKPSKDVILLLDISP